MVVLDELITRMLVNVFIQTNWMTKKSVGEEICTKDNREGRKYTDWEVRNPPLLCLCLKKKHSFRCHDKGGAKQTERSPGRKLFGGVSYVLEKDKSVFFWVVVGLLVCCCYRPASVE